MKNKKKGEYPMRNIVLGLAFAALASGCVAKPLKSQQCAGGLPGHKTSKLHYDKRGFSMDPKTLVPKKSEFWVRLKPSRQVRNKEIEIIGISGTLPNGDPTPFDWLNKTGKYTDSKFIVLCVPQDVPAKTVYKFDVNVQALGVLDPRIEVTN